MVFETDPNRIKVLALGKEDENIEFRSYLKGNVDIEVLDEAIHHLYAEIHPRIDCMQCANCCRESRIWISTADIARLMKGLQIEVDSFCKEYLQPEELAADPLPAVLPEPTVPQPAEALPDDDDDDEEEEEPPYSLRAIPCPFLTGNVCSCYDHRPECCRSYPHLHKDRRMFSLLGILEAVSVCPIVYNVYERLKDELWEDPTSPLSSADSWVDCDDRICFACDDMGPIDDLGLCESCAAKLDRDMIRDRDWARSVTAFMLSESDCEKLRRRVMVRYGVKHELIAPGPGTSTRTTAPQKGCGRKGGKSRHNKRKRK